jgi:hypothetical protein
MRFEGREHTGILSWMRRRRRRHSRCPLWYEDFGMSCLKGSLVLPFSEPFERTRGLLRQGLLAVLTPGNDRLAAFWSSA